MDRISLVPPELYGNIGYTNSIIERIPLSIELTTNDGLELNDQSGDGSTENDSLELSASGKVLLNEYVEVQS